MNASKKETRGRPPMNPEDRQIRRNINLSPELAEKARKIGGGNISRGIREALEQYPDILLQ